MTRRTAEPIERVLRRIEIEREDSDTSLFHALLYAGEAIFKTVVLGLVAATGNEEQRYRQVHQLVRADGLGHWVDVLNEVTQGPASSSLVSEARAERNALTKRLGQSDDAWQFSAVQLLHSLLASLDPACDPLPARVAGQAWFGYFVQLRNKTRGHGAPVGGFYRGACEDLQRSIELWIDHFPLFERPWAYLHQNLSGRYRITPLSDSQEAFRHLKSGSPSSMPDGVYVFFDRPVRVLGLESTVDALDFHYWNGAFTNSSHELISYASGDTVKADSAPYLKPASGLPASETRATTLDVLGRCYANLPPLQTGYVRREELEAALRAELLNEHHLAVTLIGRGGIGKTSLALATLHALTNEDRFGAVIWFSARDIDLLPQGPRQVRPDVLSAKDMARQLVELVDPEAGDGRGFDVGGMSRTECDTLARATAAKFGVERWLSEEVLQELYEEAEGHPYVVKVLVGEAAKQGRPGNVKRIVATREDMLEALFERTYATLSPPAQRVFLTLASWRSAVPQLALEAVLLRPANERMDVSSAVEELEKSSLIDISVSGRYEERFLSLPLVGAVFGKRKLRVTPFNGWKRLAELSSRSGDDIGEIQARIEGARLPAAPFSAASDAAHRLNGMLSRGELALERSAKEVLATQVLGLIDSRRTELDARDCSRAAWLCIHVKDLPGARRYTRLGLDGSSPRPGPEERTLSEARLPPVLVPGLSLEVIVTSSPASTRRSTSAV